MNSKKALITGISGQDGYYLSRFLIGKGYEVFGLDRRKALEDKGSYRSIPQEVKIIGGDITNYADVVSAVQTCPDEIYHLAAQSDVKYSFADPFSTMETNVMGTQHILEAMKRFAPKARFYFAGSSEQFGSAPAPQNENTQFQPRSPYGISKVAGFHLTRNYCEQGYFCCSGILFNHESPKRGKEFVTRKITSGLGKILWGQSDKIFMGNLDAKRDWGFAGDYVEAMWRMLQNSFPDDYVVATGETHTVEEFLDEAFKLKGREYRNFLEIDEELMRPTEVNFLCGDYSKAKRILGWEPKVKFKDLVKMMVEADCV